MASNKIGRINDDIQRVLADRLRQIKDPRVKNAGLISITRTDTTGDLRYCKVFISVMGLENEKEFMKGIKSASGWLRRELGIALNLRYTPELVFELDDSIEYGARINRVIEELEISKNGEEDPDEDN